MGKQRPQIHNLIIEHDSLSFKDDETGKGKNRKTDKTGQTAKRNTVIYEKVDVIDLAIETATSAINPKQKKKGLLSAARTHNVCLVLEVDGQRIQFDERYIKQYWAMIKAILKVNRKTEVNPIIPETEEDLMTVIQNWKVTEEQKYIDAEKAEALAREEAKKAEQNQAKSSSKKTSKKSGGSTKRTAIIIVGVLFLALAGYVLYTGQLPW